VFSVDAFRGLDFEARVREIRKGGLEMSHVVTYSVLASADNPDQRLLPGMTANVAIVVGEQTDALRVPNAAIRLRLPGRAGAPQDLGDWVWTLLESGEPIAVGVETGISDRIHTEIAPDDLTVGQQVIVGFDAPGASDRR
jgi:HlyD family secretion protein